MNRKFLSRILAFFLMALVLCGCARKGMKAGAGPVKTGDEKDQTVTLVWYMSLNSVAPDTDLVIKELNRYTRQKIGVEIEYHGITDMDYQQKMPIYINTGEYFDICYTSIGTVNYPQYVQKHAFLDISGLLPVYARETYEFIPQALWNGVTVNGGIYGVPSYKELGWQGGILVNSDMAKEYGVDLSAVKTIGDYEDLLNTVKAKSSKEGRAVIPVSGLTGHQGFVLTHPYESITGNPSLPGAFKVEGSKDFADEAGDVFNQYATPEYRRYCQMARRWYQSGYTPSDPVRYDNDTANRDKDFQSGKLFSYLLSYAPGTAETEARRTGHGVEFVPLMSPLFETRNSMDGILAVSAGSEHPEKALEFINLLNTDQYVGTLIRHGIEGIHYVPSGEDRVDKTAPSMKKGYDYTYGWQFGSPFNQKWDISYPDNIVELYHDYNISAAQAPHLGFTFQSNRVDRTLLAVTSVVEEYTPALEAGMVEPDKNIDEFLKALKDSGVETLLSEIRQQLLEYERQRFMKHK